MTIHTRDVMKRIAVGSILGGLTAVAFVFLKPREFESIAEFMPAAPAAGRIERLAGTLGLGSLGEVGQSADFYVHLLDTEQLYRSLIATCAVNDKVPCPTSIGELVVREIGTASDSAAAIRSLRRRIATGAGQNSGVVQVRVRMATAEEAKFIGLAILDWIHNFNAQRRASSARAERKFLEGRAIETQQDLARAESARADFIRTNREFGSAPELQVEADRLSREVGLRQATYTEVRTALEQSRLDEVRDTPLITVVQHPTLALIPVSRHGVYWVLLGIILGAVTSILVTKGHRDWLLSQARQIASAPERTKSPDSGIR